MASRPATSLDPRKKPRQARSQATLDAIFEAAIQVLLVDGPQRLTTTRVAERAGVSVGSMYQYFPNKQAMFYALNARYLDRVAERVELVCRQRHGATIDVMVSDLVTVYCQAKTERPDVTRALYRSIVELDNEALIDAFAHRVDAAAAAMFVTARDAAFDDLPTVNLTLLSTIFGTVRNVFERHLPPATSRTVYDQLKVMCIAYLAAMNKTPANAAR